MSEWLRVDPARYAKGKVRTLGGTAVNTAISPFDIPNAVRSTFDPEVNRCLFEFAYSGMREDTESHTLERGIAVSSGENSGRLRQVSISPLHGGKYCSRKELEAADKALEIASRKTGSWRRSVNMDVVREILTSNANDLVLDESDEILEG